MAIEKKKTQEQTLLELFASGVSISQLDAITRYGIGHLSSVISRMRLEHRICVQKAYSTSNTGSRYMEYYMDKDKAKLFLEKFYGDRNNE